MKSIKTIVVASKGHLVHPFGAGNSVFPLQIEKAEIILEQLYGSLFTRRMQLFYSISNFAELKQNVIEKKGCVRDLWHEISADITSLLEEGKAAGEFDSSIPTAVMLSTFFCFLPPRSYKRLMDEEHIPANELAKHVARIYFKGITA